MKMNSTKTNIRSTMKKVVVKENKAPEVVTIEVKPKSSSSSSSSNDSTEPAYNVLEIARNLKCRLSNVAKRLTSDAVNVTEQQNSNVSTPALTLSPMSTTVSMDDVELLSSSESSSCIATPPPAPMMTMLANADWSNNEYKPSLYHLGLLGQYLTFVSQEINEIHLEKDNVQITLSNESDEITPETDMEQASRLGATLIELSIHDPSMKISTRHQLKNNNPNGASRTNRRRRPGRPPKSVQKLLNDDNNDQLKMKNKRHTLHQQQQQAKSNRKESIDCICNVAHEEFGTMVQCDDCLSWLHLDCLELSEKALQETFRCPSCFIKFGTNGEAKLLSTVTWRYAAKYQSEVLAATAGHLKHDDEEEEDEEDDDMDDGMEIDSGVSVFSCHNTLLPLVVPNSNEDWCDSVSNSSLDGYSEAGTPPSEYQAGSDDYWFAPPSAANVFLWENNHFSDEKINPATTSLLSSTSTFDIEPSSICAQELPKFNFWDVTF